MCIFSGEVHHVSSTSIFARWASPGRQLLAYAMTVAADQEVAMILPLPVPPGSSEGAVRFIDLSGYPRLFHDLESAFAMHTKSFQSIDVEELSVPLVVHEVGDFDASFVPDLAAFSRLDPRFRLDAAVWRELPGYADHGFAVFKLRGLASGAGADIQREFHPMAFEFATRDPARLFFPTVHVHDGKAHARADFDHALYVQVTGEAPLVPTMADRPAYWNEGPRAGAHVRVADTRGLVDADGSLFAARLVGPRCATRTAGSRFSLPPRCPSVSLLARRGRR